jgi:hypothetical protein
MQDMDTAWIDAGEAGALLGESEQRVAKLAALGVLVSSGEAGDLRIERASVERTIASRAERARARAAFAGDQIDQIAYLTGMSREVIEGL